MDRGESWSGISDDELYELTGIPRTSARARRSAPPRRVRRPSRGRARLGRRVLAVVLTVSAGVAASQLGLFGLAAGLSSPQRHDGAPTPGYEETDHPLGVPAAGFEPSDSHRYLALQADGTTPVTWDPCRPIHYVVRPDNQPDQGPAILADAFARVGAATGLQFVDDGATDETPTLNRPEYQPDRYGDRWAPVLVAWATSAEDPDLAADVVGDAGPVSLRFAGLPSVDVSGQVDLDAAQVSDLVAHGEDAVARAIVLHELGHLVGLAHVDDATQLMYPETSAVVDYGAGDLTGLAALGAGPCRPDY